jgi:hypothetical protein
MAHRLPSESDVQALEFLNSEQIALELGIERGNFYMKRNRGMDFPDPVISVGPCTVWIRTAELQEAIDRYRA